MGIPRPEDHEKDSSPVLAELFAAWVAFWEEKGRLTASQHRRKRLEEDVICSFAGGELTPPAWVIRDVRNGKAERDRAGRLRWRREGYTLDSEHRVVAPRKAATFTRRPDVAVVTRPREGGRGRSRVTRAGPSGDDEPEPPAASPFQAAWRSALHLTAGELDTLVSHARIRIAVLRRWPA